MIWSNHNLNRIEKVPEFVRKLQKEARFRFLRSMLALSAGLLIYLAGLFGRSLRFIFLIMEGRLLFLSVTLVSFAFLLDKETADLSTSQANRECPS